MTDRELFEGSDDEEPEEDVSIPTYVIPPTNSITNKLWADEDEEGVATGNKAVSERMNASKKASLLH